MDMTKEQVLYDQNFNLRFINKYASLMTLGNGYLGMRGSTEEHYAEQVRGMYMAGIYNKATPNETSDLVNLPDVVGMRIELDEDIFSLLSGEILSYKRMLNLEAASWSAIFYGKIKPVIVFILFLAEWWPSIICTCLHRR